MAKKRGVVFRISEKQWDDDVTLYSFKLDGVDKWFRMGEDRNKGIVEEGYEIGVVFEEDRKGNQQVERVKLLKKGEPKKAKPKGNNNRGGYKGGGNSGYNSPESIAERKATQDNIHYQAARKDAQAQVDLLLRNEAIKLPAKTKFSEKQEVIDGLVDLYTAKFFLDMDEFGAVPRANGETESPQSVDDDDFDGDDDDDFDESEDGEDDDEW